MKIGNIFSNKLIKTGANLSIIACISGICSIIKFNTICNIGITAPISRFPIAPKDCDTSDIVSPN